MKSWWDGPFLPGIKDYSRQVTLVLARVLCSPDYKRKAANDPPVEHWGWQ